MVNRSGKNRRVGQEYDSWLSKKKKKWNLTDREVSDMQIRYWKNSHMDAPFEREVERKLKRKDKDWWEQ